MIEITGKRYEQIHVLDGDPPLVSPEPADPVSWSDQAVKQNLSVIAAEYGLVTAQENVKLQKSGHYPTLELTASHFDTSANASRFGSATGTEDDVYALKFTLPIFQGGYVNSRTREAAHLVTESADQLEKARREVILQSHVSYNDVASNIARVKALNQALVSTQSALDATSLGFEVGTRTAVDFLDSQREVYRAKRELSLARYAYISATVRLKLAAGTLSPADLGEINSWLSASAPTE